MTLNFLFHVLIATLLSKALIYNVPVHLNWAVIIGVVLYADVLFIIDFSMDVISLWVAGRITHSKMKASRVSVAASVGAAVTVLSTVLSLGSASSAILGAAVSVVMCLIAFKYGGLLLLAKRLAVIWGSGMLLGGIMTYLMTLGNRNGNGTIGGGRTSVISLVPLSVAIIFVLTGVIASVSSKKEVTVILKYRGRSVILRGLADSGNLLKDSFTGDAVIVVFFDKIRGLFDSCESAYLESKAGADIPESFEGRLRYISATGITGETLLPLLKMDEIVIDRKDCRAVVAIDINHSRGEYDCIVPQGIM